jgi:predicted ATPase/class 3 adenylate cyclase
MTGDAARRGALTRDATGVSAPSGTVTFLFTDIEGSTALWQQDEGSMGAALARHDELLQTSIAAHGGMVFSSMGDGMAAAFSSAASAVQAALAAQGLMAEETWPTAWPIRVRMGVHSGQAELRDGDYFGTAVNRAARLMAVAHGGQVLVSGASAGLVDAAVAWLDLGEHRLRDLDRPMHVFQVGAGSFPALCSLDVLPGNLPWLAGSFVGRQTELAAVAEELGASRLVTITGVGGVGKTRLALEVAAEVLPGFADGAWLVELPAASNGDQMLQIVATALGALQRQGMTLAESIVDFLRPQQLLVILDNAEHLLDFAAELAEAILAGAAGVRILVTSREGLAIPGEHLWPLRSLSVEGVAGGAGASEAVLLFAERAGAVAPDFILDAASVPAVVEVCRRLDGIPLAIELAAARVAVMGPAEIAGHLDERFRLLTGGRRGRVERHQTLLAAIEWSYDLLTETERSVFDRLGVFPASFDEAAAVAVAASGGIERWDVIDSLASLVAKSMVGVDRSGDTTRYQLLETLRHFARDRARDHLDHLRRCHAAHYAELAEQAGAGMMSPDELVWRARVAAELDNLRAATGWAFDAADLDDVSLGVKILGAVIDQILVKPSWGIQAWVQAAVRRVDELPAADRTMVVAAAASDAFFLGQMDRAEALGRQVIAESTGYPPGLLNALTAVSLSMATSGDPGGAMAVMDEGRRRQQGDPASDDYAACGLQVVTAWIAHYVGDHDTARSVSRSGFAAAKRLGVPGMLATALGTHARTLSDQDPEQALAAADECIRLVEAGAGNENIYGAAQQTAAILRSAKGDVEDAAHAIRAGIEYNARAGNRLNLAVDVPIAIVVLASRPRGLQAAATLTGAATGPVLGHFDALLDVRDRYESAVTKVTDALGSDDYTHARDRGASMTLDEIIDFALSSLDYLTDGGSIAGHLTPPTSWQDPPSA